MRSAEKNVWVIIKAAKATLAITESDAFAPHSGSA